MDGMLLAKNLINFEVNTKLYKLQIMANKTKAKEIMKLEKSQLHKEIETLKKNLEDYKVERKANWKAFKNKINEDIDKVKKLISKFSSKKLAKV